MRETSSNNSSSSYSSPVKNKSNTVTSASPGQGISMESKDLKTSEYKMDQIPAFYNMLPINNLAFTLKHGVLSRDRRDKLAAQGESTINIANPEVQKRRERKTIPYTNAKGKTKKRSLHRFANLYLNAHNAMMAAVVQHHKMCVLQISKEILNRGDVILTDQNAATDKANFFSAKQWSLSSQNANILNRDEYRTKEESDNLAKYKKIDLLYEENSLLFNQEIEKLKIQSQEELADKIKEIENKRQIRQAEALVRSKVKPRFITKILVSNSEDQKTVKTIVENSEFKNIPIIVHPTLFKIYEPLSKISTPDLTDSQKSVLEGDDHYGYPSDLSDTEDEQDTNLSETHSESSVKKRTRSLFQSDVEEEQSDRAAKRLKETTGEPVHLSNNANALFTSQNNSSSNSSSSPTKNPKPQTSPTKF